MRSRIIRRTRRTRVATEENRKVVDITYAIVDIDYVVPMSMFYGHRGASKKVKAKSRPWPLSAFSLQQSLRVRSRRDMESIQIMLSRMMPENLNALEIQCAIMLITDDQLVFSSFTTSETVSTIWRIANLVLFM